MTWPRSDMSRRSPWTKEEIRRARHIPLKPALDKLGYRFNPIKNDNYVILGLPGEIVIKDHYWICTETGSAGNSIDFLVKIRGMSFAKAMELLLS